MADPSKEQAEAREEVMKCEQEIQSIKAALRRLGTDSGSSDQNSLDIVLLKVDGLPEDAKPTLTLQLSSPVEEATLSQVFDSANSDPAPEGSLASFEGVETSMATLTVSAKDADVALGSSAPHELAPLCVLDPMDVKDQYVTELPVGIVPEQTGEAVAEAVSETEEKGEKTEESTEEAAPAEVVQPTCTLTLRVTFKPSPKDQREALYEVLNKTSQRKATALENLRKISMSMTRSGDAPSKGDATPSTVAKSSSVKPGFLNKKKKEPTAMERIYEKTIGPDSLLRRGFGLAVVARNYIIFFGSVAFFHFQGQMLALPPPV